MGPKRPDYFVYHTVSRLYIKVGMTQTFHNIIIIYYDTLQKHKYLKKTVHFQEFQHVLRVILHP